MTLNHTIGNVVWQFRRKIVSIFIFAAGLGSYILVRPFLVACGGGKLGIGAKLIACVVAWMSGH